MLRWSVPGLDAVRKMKLLLASLVLLTQGLLAAHGKTRRQVIPQTEKTFQLFIGVHTYFCVERIVEHRY